jgi:hypothetical protein
MYELYIPHLYFCLSISFFYSHFSILIIRRIASLKSVKTPVTKLNIKELSLSHSNMYIPKLKPVKKPKKSTVIKPKPNDMAKLKSYFS